MSLLYILLALLLLGVLITVHEFGHFAASRLCGIEVKEFSIGFGSKLKQWKSKKTDTVFSIRPIPLGGYCMFYGDTDDDPDGKKQDDPRNYNKAPVWKRLISVFSGPLMNFVLAFVLAFLLMVFFGSIASTPYLAAVNEGEPAYLAGLREGDRFVSIQGMNMRQETVQSVADAIASANKGQPIAIVVQRDDEELSFEITPLYNEEEQCYMIGIMIAQGYEHLPIQNALPAAWELCKEASTALWKAISAMITTGEGVDQMTGPIGTIQLVAQETQQGGLDVFLYLAIIISINLGMMNLLPIPGLDGSRIVFLLVEAVRGKPAGQKLESTIHLIGYALLIGLMIFITGKDLMRIFNH